ncbi:hypothetical protein JCM12856_26870 [Spirochaeta dissipatitropha]
MDYPRQLLPAPNFRLIDVDQLDTASVCIRRIDVANESTRKMNGLSVSLAGLFLPEHFKFRVVPSDRCPEPNECWRPGDRCVEPRDVTTEIETVYSVVYLPLCKWHRKPFPVRDEVHENISTSLSGVIRMVHCPTVINFWHFEIQFGGAAAGDGIFAGCFVEGGATAIRKTISIVVNYH